MEWGWAFQWDRDEKGEGGGVDNQPSVIYYLAIYYVLFIYYFDIFNVSSTKKTLRLATWIIRELAANYREFFFIQYICLEIYEKFTVNSRKFV